MKPTAIDLAQSAHYAKFPELIHSIDTNWETLRFCKKCEGEIPANHSCLFWTANGFNVGVEDSKILYGHGREGDQVKDHHVSCPHCGVQNKALAWHHEVKQQGKESIWRPLECIFSSKPIEINLVFRRKVWLSRKRRKLFRWVGEDKFFWEYSEVKPEGVEDNEPEGV